jgi:hypothetical protein
VATVILIVVVVVVLLLVGGGITTSRAGRRTAAEHDELAESNDDTLRFRTVPGQDPAAVLSVLQQAGYDAYPAPEDSHTVVIVCPEGRQAAREDVRTLIAGAGNVDPAADPFATVPVRFADE